MAKVKHDDPEMNGERARNDGNGRMHQKRADTKGSTLNETYGTNFPPNTTLGDLRDKYGVNSIQDIIKMSQGK